MNYLRCKYNTCFNIIKYIFNFIYSMLKNILKRGVEEHGRCETEKFQDL